MSNQSFVSNDDSTSICAVNTSLDIRVAFDMVLRTRYALPKATREKVHLLGASTLVAKGNISNANEVSIYRILSVARNISSCEATYRQKERIFIK